MVSLPDRMVKWMGLEWYWDVELKKYVKELTDSVDCIVLGRKLAEGFIPYWESHPEEEGAETINKLLKIVFSKTIKAWILGKHNN